MATPLRLASLAIVLLLTSCSWVVPSAPLPVNDVPALTQPVKRLVIVLPGLGEDMADLERSGIAAAIHRGMPDADIKLTLASVRYYLDGGMPRRVHEQVVVPARQRYAEIWLAGASMGGGGVTAYEREYPGEMNGLILLAPFMGPDHLVEEIRAAGGLSKWDPGPQPAVVDSFEINAREQWRTVQSWNKEPLRNRNVWLTCGTADEQMSPAAELIAQVLPKDHYFKTNGIHDWVAWTGPVTTIFTRIASADTAHRE